VVREKRRMRLVRKWNCILMYTWLMERGSVMKQCLAKEQKGFANECVHVNKQSKECVVLQH
jgi:hypothetical protein